MSLKDRVALVTGGTGALGRAVVKHLVNSGARVHVPWIMPEEVEQLYAFLGADATKVRLYQSDVTREDQVDALFANLDAQGGRLDILANIVGGFVYASLAETDAATWRKMLEMNATSAFLCCRAAVTLMQRNNWGRIVNVAAVPALGRGAASMSAYSASKAAVLNFTYSLSAELRPYGITANAIVPSIIDTPANRKSMPGADTKTWLNPAEIADVVGFLASDAAHIVTGSALNLTLG